MPVPMLTANHDGVKLRTILRQPWVFLQGFRRASSAPVPPPSAGCGDGVATVVMLLAVSPPASAAGDDDMTWLAVGQAGGKRFWLAEMWDEKVQQNGGSNIQWCV